MIDLVALGAAAVGARPTAVVEGLVLADVAQVRTVAQEGSQRQAIERIVEVAEQGDVIDIALAQAIVNCAYATRLKLTARIGLGRAAVALALEVVGEHHQQLAAG